MSLIRALLDGDENAFTVIVERYHASLVYVARGYIRDPAAAEAVAQETWVAFLGSIDRFDGRCSISTLLHRILFSKAQTRATANRILVPFSTLAADEASSPMHSVDPSSFRIGGNDGLDGHWVESPPNWMTDPEQILLDKKSIAAAQEAIAQLPTAQRTVMQMRDVDGLSSTDVCSALGISASNQRALLHRARSKVRRALAERYDTAI